MPSATFDCRSIKRTDIATSSFASALSPSATSRLLFLLSIVSMKFDEQKGKSFDFN